MDIYLMDGLDGPSEIIDQFESVIWTVQYSDLGELQLVLPATDKNIDMIQTGLYLVRDFDCKPNEYQNVMLIDRTELSYDVEDGWRITVSGKSLKYLMHRRIVWHNTTIDGNLEDGIRLVIDENCINPTNANRKISDMIMTAKKNLTETVTDVQLFGEYIDEWLVEICTQYELGWEIYIKNGKYVFDLYQGVDRTYDQNVVLPVVFSPEFDNLQSSNYIRSIEEYCNAAVVAGEGEGATQRSVVIGDTSGIKRIETFIDGSSLVSDKIITLDVYLKMLEDYGKTEMANITAKIESFEGTILSDGMYKLNRDYFLGDVVQIVNEHGIRATTRISEIIYSEDESGQLYTPTFSAWE